MMNNEALIKYHSSLSVVKSMERIGLIDHEDFLKAEAFLADKYCIKIGSIYRSNDLIIPSNRVIYSGDSKEEQGDEDSNKNRSVTAINKAN